MLRDAKIICMHLGCVVCLLAKIILQPFAMLSVWVQKKIDATPTDQPK